MEESRYNVLSLEQVRHFERDGIWFPISVLSAGEVARFHSAFEEWESHFSPSPDPIRCRQLHLFFRWAYDLATHPAVLDAVGDILGPDILVHSTTMFCKRPQDPSYVSWHQDGYYWNLDTPQLASAWISLSDSTVENGCLRVIPGSHKQGTIPHAESSISELNMLTSGLEVAVDVDESRARNILLRAGEMSLHHVNIIHGSNSNRSNTERVGFAVRFAAPCDKQAIQHHSVVLARGRDDYHHFDLLREPPTASIDEGIAAHAEFLRWWRKIRSSSELNESQP